MAKEDHAEFKKLGCLQQFEIYLKIKSLKKLIVEQK